MPEPEIRYATREDVEREVAVELMKRCYREAGGRVDYDADFEELDSALVAFGEAWAASEAAVTLTREEAEWTYSALSEAFYEMFRETSCAVAAKLGAALSREQRMTLATAWAELRPLLFKDGGGFSQCRACKQEIANPGHTDNCPVAQMDRAVSPMDALVAKARKAIADHQADASKNRDTRSLMDVVERVLRVEVDSEWGLEPIVDLAPRPIPPREQQGDG